MVHALCHKVFRLAGTVTSKAAANHLPGGDVTVGSAYTQPHLAVRARERVLAAAQAEKKKMTRNAARSAAQKPPMRVLPLASDTTGALGPGTLGTARQLARKASSHARVFEADALRKILTSLSSTLMKNLALQVNVRSKSSSPEPERRALYTYSAAPLVHGTKYDAPWQTQ